MSKVTVMRSSELLNLTGTGTATKNQKPSSDFKDLLSSVMQGRKTSDTPKLVGPRGSGKRAETQEYPAESGTIADTGKKTTLADDKSVKLDANGKPVEQQEKADDMDQAAMMGMVVQEPLLPIPPPSTGFIEEAAGVPQTATDQQAIPVTATLPPVNDQVVQLYAETPAPQADIVPVQQTDAAAQSTPQTTGTQQSLPVGADIRSTDTTVSSSNGIKTSQNILQSNATPQSNTDQQRFDDLISKAQQQLQDLSRPPTADTAAANSVPNPPGSEINLEQAPPGHGAIVNPDTPAGAESAPETQAEIESKPGATPTTTVQSQADRAPGPQRPLREIPESDESVMKMQQTQAVVNKEPEQILEAERPEPLPQQRPVYGADQAEQIRIQVTENLEKNKMEFRMQLQPEELGKVNIKMVIDSGRLIVEIMAADPRAAYLLNRQTEALAQSLRAGNLEVQSIQVVEASQSAGSHMDSAFNMMNGQAWDGGSEGAAGSNPHGGRTQNGRIGKNDSQDTHSGSSTEVENEPRTLLNYRI